ncbi:2-C-methyl-D-erythritol 2,4-cyclodiphosphate synthase [bacterium]|nr:2-C-methyl-D-erythritol 2,4-cyclodiphosphate synthase [bacterium]
MEASQIPIGGVPIPCRFKIQAHSDGDVLLHALVDACLGALALGDIGQHFSDKAPENKNRPSREFILDVNKKIRSLGYRVASFDSIVILEEPKLSGHSDAIRRSIATLLEIELACVSVKAKTMEGLGLVGENKAIAAHAVVNLEPLPR